MSQKAKASPVVAVLNMKGGVGKTTISANLFRVLFQRKSAGTLLIDLDPQFNLTQTLLTRDQYDAEKKAGKTILAAMEALPSVGLFQVNTSTSPPPKPSDIGVPFKYMIHAPTERLDMIPGDFALAKYSLMDDASKLAAVRKRFENFVTHAKDSYKVVCIDCNPSSSFLTLCALRVCTHVLVPVRPDRYSILGLEMLSEFIAEIPSISPKPELIVLLNGMQRYRAMQDVESELRGHAKFGARVMASVIYKTDLLTARTDYTGFATDKKVPYSKTLNIELRNVADELSNKIGI